MPALTKMESSFSWRDGLCPVLLFLDDTVPRLRDPSSLMHARRYAVAAVSLHRRRATGESAEEGESYDKRK